MKPEEGVVSLDVAKRMKDAGWEQEPNIAWFRDDKTGEYFVCESGYGRCTDRPVTQLCHAPSVAELGEAMLKAPYAAFDFKTAFYQDRVEFCYGERTEVGRTEADARALMWLYLKDKGII